MTADNVCQHCGMIVSPTADQKRRKYRTCAECKIRLEHEYSKRYYAEHPEEVARAMENRRKRLAGKYVPKICAKCGVEFKPITRQRLCDFCRTTRLAARAVSLYPSPWWRGGEAGGKAITD